MTKPDRNRGDGCCAAQVAQMHAIAQQLYWLNQFLMWQAGPGDDVTALDDATGPPPPPPPPPPLPELGGD